MGVRWGWGFDGGAYARLRTVNEKYDGFGSGAVLGLGDVGGEIIDYFDFSCRCAFVDFA